MILKTRALTALLSLTLCLSSFGCSDPPPADVEPRPKGGMFIPAVTNPDIPEEVRAPFAQKCVGCHGADGKGGPVAPNLFALESRRTASGWAEYLKNPPKLGKRMPPIPLTPDEARVLGAWLATIAGP
jgi:cytochrome c553